MSTPPRLGAHRAAPARATTRRSSPRRAYHHGDLRRTLIRAALALLARGEPRALSLRDLARRAGVSTAAPYRHFSSKAAVLAAVAEEGFRVLTVAMRERMEAAPPAPLARLREAGVAYVLFAHAQPAHYRVMFGPQLVEKSAHPELAHAAAEAFAVFMGALRAGVRADARRGGDPRRLALAAWSGVHGLASLISAGQLELLDRDASRTEELAREVATTLITGLAGAVPRRAPRRRRGGASDGH